MKMLVITLLMQFAFTATLMAQENPQLSDLYNGDEIFMISPGAISTTFGEFSPFYDVNTNELYFMRRTPGVFDYTIYQATLTGNGWRDEKIAPFSGQYRDAAPYLSPDGQTIYFDSKHPSPEVADDSINLWFSRRTDSGWSAPQLIRIPSLNPEDEPIPGRDEFGPAVDEDGNLYFYSFRQPYRGGRHYISPAPDYDEVRLNTELPDPSARTFVSYLYITPDRSLALLEGRAEGRGDTDIFCSGRNEDGSWSEPVTVPKINTRAGEGTPSMTADGQFILFASDRATDRQDANNVNLYIIRSEGLLNDCIRKK